MRGPRYIAHNVRKSPPPHDRTLAVTIGTLNEGALHEALKALYADGGQLEQKVDGYVADIVRDDGIVEIQTKGFSALKRKLPRLLETHCVTLVHPVAVNRHIIKLPRDDGGVTTRRRSPKHGSLFDAFAELVYIPHLLDHENLVLDIVLTDEEEVRAEDGKGGRRRGGWGGVGRRLIDVRETHHLTSMADLFEAFPGALPGQFTTADIATALAKPRRLAQQAAYCLRAAGLIRISGKAGNALIYERCPRLPQR